MLENIKLTKKELTYMKESRDNLGIESYIYKVDEKTSYKIFRTQSPEVLENKFQKIKALHQKNIDFMVTPLATLSCDGNFVGYQMILLENLEWYPFPLNTKALKELKKYLLQLEENNIIYGDI